jgi:tetratricopeptide (TPR) repeat protein
MAGHQEEYDEAMFAFSRGDYDSAIAQLKAVLAEEPGHFEAQLALGMAYYRKGDFAAAILEGHKAEQLKPQEQLVHTNLSLFYMRAGNKPAAEHHGLQAKLASWRTGSEQASAGELPPRDPELELSRPKPKPMKFETKFPDMPWKKKAPPAKGG